MDKIAVYKMKRRGSATPTCKKLVSFDYKTVGATTVTFQYKECGGIVNTVTYSLSPTAGSFVTYVIADSPSGEFCLELGTLVRISGLSTIQEFVYADCDI